MTINLRQVAHETTANACERRTSSRKQMAIPGRIIWRDSEGTPRFSSIVTRDVSDRGALVECLSGPPIPRHRLVHVQLDRAIRGFELLPPPLRQGKLLAAVYRVGPVSRVTGLPEGYALRLMVEPSTLSSATPATVFERPDVVVALPA